MIKAAVAGLDDDEKRMLYKCLVKLDSFFHRKNRINNCHLIGRTFVLPIF